MTGGCATNPARTIGLLFIAFALTAAVPLPSAAQDDLGRGRITGQVADAAGGPVAGARVVAKSLKGSSQLETVTDKRGHFAIAGLGSGVWRVTVSKDGYVNTASEVNVTQLKSGPPIALTLEKLAGVQGLQADSSALSLIDKGNALIDQGDYDGAVAMFTEFQGKYPDVYQTRLNIATAYLKKGDLDRSAAEFKGVLDTVLRVRGDYKNDKATAIRALAGLGELAVKQGDMAAAQKYFSEALAISPEDESAAYNVGELLFSNQKSDEAVKYLELAIQIKKGWPKPYYKLGFVYLNKGDYAKSLEYFNKFIALDPTNPEIPNVKNVVAAIEKIKK
jgi:tetratricopeptide (TPR) repeat protein